MLTGFTKGIKWKKEKTRESEPHVRWEEYELEKEWTKKKKKKVEEKEGTNTDNLRASTLKKKQGYFAINVVSCTVRNFMIKEHNEF